MRTRRALWLLAASLMGCDGGAPIPGAPTGSVGAPCHADGTCDAGLRCNADSRCEDADPCAGVDCSGHGSCATDGASARCACDPGYVAEDTACVAFDSRAFLRLNAGGTAYTGAHTWVADAPASGLTFSPANAGTNSTVFTQNSADEAALLASERWWDIGAGQAATATVSGLENGTYAVRFLIAEGVWTAAGQRVFGFSAEGAALDSGIDPFALAGSQMNVGVWRQYEGIEVTDGELNLDWSAAVDNPALRAIELAGPGFAEGTPPPGPRFPRLGAVAISSPQNYDSSTFRDGALKHHVVIVSHWPGWQSNHSMTMAEVMQDVKTRSTVGTKMFIYVNNDGMNDPMTSGDANYPIWQKVNAEQWWLYPSGTSGSPVTSFYPGQKLCNNTDLGTTDAAGKNWIRWKADFDYAFNVVGDASNAANPYVDGFFMDNVFWKPRNDGDWNLDGSSDSQNDAIVQGWLRAGYKSYFDYIRSIWPGSTQIGNIADWYDPATIGVLDQVTEGGLIEGIVGTNWSLETWGGFAPMMAAYRKIIDACVDPKLVVFHHIDWAAGDWRGMRYSLAAALMDDGYYAISPTSGYSPTLLWFDELDFDLGYPTEPRQSAAWSQGVWRRDFDNGIVLLNPMGNGPQAVSLGGTFYKLAGTQDAATNDGATVTSVTLADRDGIILSR